MPQQQGDRRTTSGALNDTLSTDSTASVESSTDAATSTDTTTSTESEQTTEEIADDESFDVDTIFTSGTEIAGGGGTLRLHLPRRINLAQMKMTRCDPGL